jgi:hypothetical protein
MTWAVGISMMVGAWVAGYLWSSLATFVKNFFNG